jgi:hypothetical protein
LRSTKRRREAIVQRYDGTPGDEMDGQEPRPCIACMLTSLGLALALALGAEGPAATVVERLQPTSVPAPAADFPLNPHEMTEDEAAAWVRHGAPTTPAVCPRSVQRDDHAFPAAPDTAWLNAPVAPTREPDGCLPLAAEPSWLARPLLSEVFAQGWDFGAGSASGPSLAAAAAASGPDPKAPPTCGGGDSPYETTIGSDPSHRCL